MRGVVHVKPTLYGIIWTAIVSSHRKHDHWQLYILCVCGAGAQKCAISRTWVVETQPFYYFMDERSLGAVSRQKSIAALMLSLLNIVWCGHISEQRDASSVGRDALSWTIIYCIYRQPKIDTLFWWGYYCYTLQRCKMRCLRLRKRHVNRQGFFMTTNQDVFILLYWEETVFFLFRPNSFV